MVALIGFIMIAAIVFLLLKGKMSPIVVLTLIPVVAALLLGYNPIEIAEFIKDGIGTTTSNGILFIFSVIYFGVMSDTGMFDVIVNFLVKKAGNNVIAVTVATAIIATIAHLDGTTATTVLITIPALYPVYKRMNIDSKILLCLTGACMGVMNLLLWGGPVARAATVLQMDANDLWHILIPIQIAGLVFNIVLAVLLGMLAVKQGASANFAKQYATKRYRSNCINWGMTPFLVENPEVFELGDYIFVPGIRKAVLENAPQMTAYAVKPDGTVTAFPVSTGALTEAERQIIADGCLINYYRNH